MKSAHDIILKPLITERSSAESALGRYTFVVAKGATKPEIRQACEQLFGVKVTAVNTQNRLGKNKRLRSRQEGRRPSWKKAIVTIDQNPAAASYLTTGGKKVQSDRKYKTAIEEFGIGQ